MTKYCTITPNRDRPELFAFCIKQLTKINGGNPPNNSYLMNERPVSEEVDLVPRIKKGIELAKRDGFEFVFIIEDDDYYPKNYFDLFGDLSNIDFVGFEDTVYYNLRNRTWQTMYHPNRSSLFCTGFRISALDDFRWPPDHTKFLDVALWEYAFRNDKRCLLLPAIGYMPIGIKHGIGKTGGKGHQMKMANHDPNLSVLNTFVDQEAYNFYLDLMTRI